MRSIKLMAHEFFKLHQVPLNHVVCTMNSQTTQHSKEFPMFQTSLPFQSYRFDAQGRNDMHKCIILSWRAEGCKASKSNLCTLLPIFSGLL
jgi:hypothetical protein